MSQKDTFSSETATDEVPTMAVKFKIVSTEEYKVQNPDCLTTEAWSSVRRFHHSFLKGNNGLDLTSSFIWLIPKHLGLGKNTSTRNRYLCSNIVQKFLEDTDLYKTSPEFRDFESGHKQSIGNTSTILPFFSLGGLREAALKYFQSDRGVTYDREILLEAKDAVTDLLLPNSLFQISVDEAFENAEKSTNWGAPFWKNANKPYDSLSSWGQIYLHKVKRILNGDEPLINYAAVMVARVQPSGDDNKPKQRVAWAISHIWTLIESTFQNPLLEALRTCEEFSEHTSQERTDSFMTRTFSFVRADGLKLIGFDASAFDTSIPSILIYIAYDIVGIWFGAGPDSILYRCRDYMVSSDLITPEGVYTGREKGVASGMAMTNMIDCMVQLLLFHYTRIKLGQPKSSCRVTVNGDDGIWVIPGLTPHILESILTEFGMKCNVKKISFSPNSVTFCQRLYLRDYKVHGSNVGIRSAFRTLNSIISFETKKRSDNPAFDSVRALVQLEGLKYNPTFERFVDLVADSDKMYGLGRSLSGGTAELFKISSSEIKISQLLAVNSWEKGKLDKLLRNAGKLSVTRYLDDIA
jgi:hypothetical protein